ncbi:hypothetical protein E2C01_056799 [Portunus trituberculatus]|uniref:Secreted protein n=1 Tax=Portunus trituberculatus TaxID=210409 RepID=A0A5B7GRT3_PORTR|nr:hypothetical protein [Portunus trituberculatus]
MLLRVLLLLQGVVVAPDISAYDVTRRGRRWVVVGGGWMEGGGWRAVDGQTTTTNSPTDVKSTCGKWKGRDGDSISGPRPHVYPSIRPRQRGGREPRLTVRSLQGYGIQRPGGRRGNVGPAPREPFTWLAEEYVLCQDV